MGRDKTHERNARPGNSPAEETFVVDNRATLTPSQHVQRKLIAVANNALPVSRLQVARLGRR